MSRARPAEQEAALVVVSRAPEQVLRRLAALRRLGTYALVPRGTEQFRDTYLDTPGGELGARHIALRIRDFAAGTAVTTLKTPGTRQGTVATRGELELPLTESAARRIFSELARLGVRTELPSAREFASGRLQAGSGEARLQPRQVRINRRLLRDAHRDGRRVAEIAIDRVRYLLDGREVRVEEVEIERKDAGTAADVAALARELVRQFGDELRPWRASKLAMGETLEKWNQQGLLSARLTRARTVRPDWLPRLSRVTGKG